MLKRIEVKNFKSLKHIDVKCAGLNLLMGFNGAGKSSFVQVLMLLDRIARHCKDLSVVVPMKSFGDEKGKFEDLKYCYSGEKDVPQFTVDFEAPRISSMFNLEERGAATTGSLTRVIKPGLARNEIRIEHPDCASNEEEYKNFLEVEQAPYKKKNGEFDLHGFLLHTHTKEFTLNRDRIVGRGKELQKDASAQAKVIAEAYFETWKNMKFVSSYRERPTDVSEESIYNEGQMILDGEFAPKPDGTDIAEFLLKFGEFINVNEDDLEPGPMIHPSSICKSNGTTLDSANITLNKQIQYWLNEVSPGARVLVDKVMLSDDNQYVMSVGFGNDVSGRKKFKPQQVGFGISYVLPVLVTLLMAKEDEIVLIENPEAHLHPKGQAAMGNLIARAVASGVQVFVETHSDHVVNGIRSAVKDGIVKPSDVNIAFFERKEHDVPNEDGTSHQEIYSEVRNIRVDKNGSLSEYPDGFLDEWNNQLMELI